MLLSKESNNKKTLCATLNSVYNIPENVSLNGSFVAFEGSSAWVVLSGAGEKIRHKFICSGKLLKDWDAEIYYGVKTGYNAAFVIDTYTRNRILDDCANDEERERTSRLIQPTLRGRDIKRYTHEWANLWLINTHNGTKDDVKPVDINKYPAVKKHLDNYKKAIEKRGDKGITAYNLRNCAYLDDLTKPKIAWIELSDTQKFTYCVDEIPLNTVFFLTGEALMYLLGLLNSKAIYWYFTKMLACSSGMGTTRWLKFTLEQVPIAESCIEQQQPIITLVNDILAAKKQNPKADTSSLEDQIDRLVYQLYGLTNAEVHIIDPAAKTTGDDNDTFVP